MKVLGLERDNTTLLSTTTDPCGFAYSASFELYPFHEGHDRAVYKGILNGYGPRRGRFCVVKAKLDHQGDKTDWHALQSVVRRSHALAASFNKLVQSASTISFEWPVIAQMETVSDFTPIIRVFKRHDKRLRVGEMVVIEDMLEGPFQTFNSIVGWVNPDSTTDVTQAFSHFTWHATRQLVVCGLQGVADEGKGFRLTTPTIHSLHCQYGPRDGGAAGIAEFFASHRCNNICSAWPGPDVPGVKGYDLPPAYRSPENKLQVHGSQRAHNPRKNCVANIYIPTAPPSPLVFIPKVPSAPTIEMTRF